MPLEQDSSQYVPSPLQIGAKRTSEQQKRTKKQQDKGWMESMRVDVDWNTVKPCRKDFPFAKKHASTQTDK